MNAKQGLASVIILLAATADVQAGGFSLPSYLTSRRTLPEYISAPHDTSSKPAGLERAGWVYKTYQSPDKTWHVRLLPYFPTPGDLLLFDDHNRLVTLMYHMVGTGAPLHTAMIFARTDQSPAILEAGPELIPSVFVVDVLRRLKVYPGTVMVRRPRQPLTVAQSENLTQFCLAQEGKDYALGRLMLQGTPFRCQVGLRKMCFAHTCMERRRWTCSELTAAAGAAAGLIDRRRCPANAMYPRDFCFDDRFNLSNTYTEPLLWTPDPVPATLVPDDKGNLRLVRDVRGP